MKGALLLVVMAGCARLDADTGEWLAATAITGELAPELGPAPTTRRAPGTTLRVASWNVHYADDPDAIVTAIAASPLATADVLFLQEVNAFPAEGETRAARIATALGMTWVFAPARHEDPGGVHGIAILSRYALSNPRVRQLPFFEEPIHARERIAVAAEVTIGARTFTVEDLHLDVRLGPVDRIAQLAPAIETLEAAGPVIMGGDFNSNPWSWFDGTVPLLGTEAILGGDQAAIVDDYLVQQGYRVGIPPTTATARIPAYSIRIDGLYARGVDLGDAAAPHVDGSDHWPIYVDVALTR